IQMFKKAAENIGLSLPLVEFGQGYKDMAPALDKLEQMLLNKQIRHGNHPVMNMCAANAITIKDASSNRKL
ncbi:terminase TerL endonuclease subunit, partial [Raoultella ornithinolytica]